MVPVELSALAVFLGAAVALILTPGPDTMYVLSRALGDGRAVGVRAAAGIATGVLVHTAAAALGLSALLRASPAAYDAVKYLGAAYLVYLGVAALRGDGPGSREREAGDGGYLQGVTVNVLNPKVALFFLAFLPGFVDAGPGVDAALGMFFLGALYAVLTLAYLGTVAVLSGRVGTALDARRTKLQYVSAAVLVGLGLHLAVGNLAA